jgi:mannose-6-phosphate isomerase-like protein (cupin superfamily)
VFVARSGSGFQTEFRHLRHGRRYSKHFEKMPQGGVTDEPIRVVDIGKGKDGVAVVLRAKAAQTAVYHSQVAEVYYVLEGSGTMVTGGTIVKPLGLQNGPIAGPTNGGTALENGQSRSASVQNCRGLR